MTTTSCARYQTHRFHPSSWKWRKAVIRHADSCTKGCSANPFNISIRPTGIRERQSTSSFNISDPHVLNIIRYIGDNYKNEISIPDILGIAPLSRRSVEVRFKKATGQTIYQYLLSMRIEHLAYLLTTTDRSPSELAYEVGFRDLSNIFRTFKRYKGCTVSEYRRRFNVN